MCHLTLDTPKNSYSLPPQFACQLSEFTCLEQMEFTHPTANPRPRLQMEQVYQPLGAQLNLAQWLHFCA